MCFHVTSVYTMYIPCIYQTCTCIYNWYCMYLLFSGFCGSYRPSAPPTHGLEDNVPDVHDEFWYPRYRSSVGNIHDPYVQAGGCIHCIYVYVLVYTMLGWKFWFWKGFNAANTSLYWSDAYSNDPTIVKGWMLLNQCWVLEDVQTCLYHVYTYM